MGDNRVGVIGILIDALDSAPQVNALLHEYAALAVGRIGVPYLERGFSVISLIVDGEADAISALTGRLGRLPGVTVKAALIKR
jgi:putative iron-only hydrogenase system regulator